MKEHCVGNVKDILKNIFPSTTRMEGDPEDWVAREDWDEGPVGGMPFV